MNSLRRQRTDHTLFTAPLVPIAPVMSDPFRITFGAPGAAIFQGNGRAGLQVALPILAGTGDEYPLLTAQEIGRTENHVRFQRDAVRGGFLLARAETDLEHATLDLYRQLFEATRGLHLHRIWNYVPAINAEEQGLENYRRFCRSRSFAFENYFGGEYQTLLPAASAVGSVAGPLAVVYLAGAQVPRHFENPQQVPAFEYPPQYGPRPPSFARATAVDDETGRQLYISGTASISGHATIATGNLAGQLDCTVSNLRLVSAAAGASADLGANDGWSRRFKVYLRRSEDLPAVAAHLERDLLQLGDHIHYLQADICRSDLLVEIEAVLATPRRR